MSHGSEEQYLFEINIVIVNYFFKYSFFTVTFDQFNASMKPNQSFEL